MAISEVKSEVHEGIHVVDEEEIFLGEFRDKGSTIAHLSKRDARNTMGTKGTPE
jgi:hypothetical protein